jgi:hypothetical protein
MRDIAPLSRKFAGGKGNAPEEKKMVFFASIFGRFFDTWFSNLG